MTTVAVQEALHEVRPGELIKEVRIRQTGRNLLRGLKRGIVPHNSPFRTPDYHVYTVTGENEGQPESVDLAFSLQHRLGYRAVVGVEARNEEVAANAAYVRESLVASAEGLAIDELIIDPLSTRIPRGTLEEVGFGQPDDEGEMHMRVGSHTPPVNFRDQLIRGLCGHKGFTHFFGAVEALDIDFAETVECMHGTFVILPRVGKQLDVFFV